MKTCPNCRKPALARSTAPYGVRVGGRRYTATVDALTCRNCGEVYLDGESAVRADLQIAAHIAAHGPITGDGFRFMRTVIGTQARDLAPLLDRRPEALSRWETGRGEIDRAAWIALGALVLDRARGSEETIQRMRALAKPVRSRRSVRIRRRAS